MEIILATESPRKIKAMKTLGLKFEIKPSNFDESLIHETDIRKLVEKLALEKAHLICKQNPGSIVIGADTLLSFQGKVLGKPKDLDEVRENLKKASGKVVDDFTGIAVVYREKEKSTWLHGVAKLRVFGSAEIENYISNGNPMDKAGGFAADPAEGGEFLESYIGEPGQELGLPTTTLKKFLVEFGVRL